MLSACEHGWGGAHCVIVCACILSIQLSIHDFAKVQEALWDARSKWYNIGICLNLGILELNNINAEPGFGLEEKFNLMIETRLKKSEPCTWRELYDVLNHPTVDMASVADKVRSKLPKSEYGTTVVMNKLF